MNDEIQEYDICWPSKCPFCGVPMAPDDQGVCGLCDRRAEDFDPNCDDNDGESPSGESRGYVRPSKCPWCELIVTARSSLDHCDNCGRNFPRRFDKCMYCGTHNFGDFCGRTGEIDSRVCDNCYWARWDESSDLADIDCALDDQPCDVDASTRQARLCPRCDSATLATKGETCGHCGYLMTKSAQDEVDETTRRYAKALERLPPPDCCPRCTEVSWTLMSLSPNDRAATYKCDYCKHKFLATHIGVDRGSHRRENLSQRVRDEVWRRDGGTCQRCGSREKLEFDHIIPVSKGGSNTARNIELLCEKCNRAKSDHIG